MRARVVPGGTPVVQRGVRAPLDATSQTRRRKARAESRWSDEELR